MKRASLIIVVIVSVVAVGWLVGRSHVKLEGPLALLEYKSVQRDLKLTDEQIAKLPSLAEKMTKSESEWGNNKAKLKNDATEVFREVGSLLNPDQLKRLEQLQMQWVGPAVFFIPRVAKKTELTAEQKVQLETIYKPEAQNLVALHSQGKMDELAKLDEHLKTEMMRVLNDVQKEKLKTLLGPPLLEKLPPADYIPFFHAN